MSFVPGGTSGGTVLGEVAGAGWWLVASPDDERRVLAGPFQDRAEAHCTALTLAGAGTDRVRPVYGVRREDGALARRPSPQEWAWLAHLGEQLERLPEDWDTVVSDDDPLTTLVVEVTAALADAGLPLHDCAGRTEGISGTGGVCLTPEPATEGIIVAWRQHDRMSVERLRGAAAEVAVHRAMNGAVAEVLGALGFVVEAFGGGGHVVRAAAQLD